MSTVFLSPNWRMPRNANQSKSSNYSLNFDGGSYINLGNSSLGLTANSISIWFKTTSTTSGQQLLSKMGSTYQFQFRLETNGTITLYSFENQSTFATLQSASGYNDGNWHNVTTTFNTTDGHKMYVDGNTTPVDTDAANKSALQSSSERMLIGARDSSTGVIDTARYFNGDISFISIFDYALSASQVTTLWGGGTSVSNPMALPRTPIAYYPLGTSTYNGEYLAENNAIEDYVFKIQSGDRINTGAINLGYQFTVSFWFQRTVTGEYRLLNITNSAGDSNTRYLVDIVYPGSNQVFSHITDTSGFQSIVDSNIPLNSWIHCAYTRNGRDSNIYLSYNGGFNKNSGANSMQFPVGQETTNTYIVDLIQSIPGDGFLSNVNYFTSILTLSEIETLYNYGSPIRTLSNIPQNSNLKAWYKLDASEIYNSSTTEWEISDATATYNSSSYVIGVSGQNTQYIESSSYDGLTGASAGSWSFWYNTQDLGVTNGKNGGWFNGGQAQWIQPYGTPHTGYTNTGEFNILTSDGRFRTSLAASYGRRIYIDAPAGGQLNKWAHIVCTYDGSNLRVYVNGEQVGTGTGVTEFAATGTISTGSLRFGGEYTGVTVVDSKFSNGSVWSKALTLAEVGEIYNNGKPKSLSSHSAVSNLVSWWTLENFTTGLLDSVGSRNVALVGSNSDVSPGSVSTLNGDSSGMSQANLVQSDLQTVAPYSKYAMSFGGIDDTMLLGSTPIVTGVFTISIWIKRTSTSSPESATTQSLISKDDISSNRVYSAFLNTSTGILSFWVSSSGAYNSASRINTSTAINDTEWHNVVFINNGNNINNQVYVDGAEVSYADQGTGISSLHSSTINLTACGNDYYAPVNAYCSMSNISMWTSAFSSFQVREIYNEGLPSNLNLHSSIGSIASWWQCGENSSFDGSNWTCVNEVASNNGVTRSMPVGALVNGVGTTANGVSASMGVGSLVSDAPYSTGNASSVNMAATAKGTNVP